MLVLISVSWMSEAGCLQRRRDMEALLESEPQVHVAHLRHRADDVHWLTCHLRYYACSSTCEFWVSTAGVRKWHNRLESESAFGSSEHKRYKFPCLQSLERHRPDFPNDTKRVGCAFVPIRLNAIYVFTCGSAPYIVRNDPRPSLLHDPPRGIRQS